MKTEKLLKYWHSIHHNRKHILFTGTISLLLLLTYGINPCFAQEKSFNISKLNADILELIEEIEDQSDYRFIYESKTIKEVTIRADFQVSEQRISEILRKMEYLYDLKFLLIGNNIAITIPEAEVPIKTTLSGLIIDKHSGDIIIGATIYCPQIYTGTITNLSGFYSLTLPQGIYTFTIQHLGYHPQSIRVDLRHDIYKTISLQALSNDIEEIVIKFKEELSDFNNFNLSRNKLNISDLKSLPSIFSEKDVFLALDVMPGISLNPENINGLSIRGTSEGENLTTVDKIQIYNISHSVSNLSIFNPDIINYLTVNKGGVPTEFGDRAASSIQVITRKGNRNRHEINGSVSNISSRMSVEGPLFKKGSYLISGRRGGLNLFHSKFRTPNISKIYYYDINSKFNFRLNEKNELTIATYWGKDYSEFFIENNQYALNQWNTNTFSADWNRIINGRFTYNLNLYTSSYSTFFNQDSLSLYVLMHDISLRNDFKYYLAPGNIFRFGMNLTNHLFDNPRWKDHPDQTQENNEKFNSSLESNVYFVSENTIFNKFKTKTGIRLSAFNQYLYGSYYFTYQPADSLELYTDSISTRSHPYISFSPSFQANYQLSKQSSIKASYNRSTQYLHQLMSNNTEGLAYKVLIPSSARIKPLTIDQISVGYMRNSTNSVFEYSVESYIKVLHRTMEYLDTIGYINSRFPIEQYIRQGRGRAYGIEFFARKKQGRLKGIISYSLSSSTKTIQGINSNKRFFSTQHQPHDFSMTLNYQLNESLKLAANFILQTGRRYTGSDGKSSEYLRNNKHLPTYHRADIGIRYENNKQKRFKSTWEFSIYNIYNRKNAYFLYKNSSSTPPSDYLYYSLYGITPTLAWSFKL